MSKTMIDSTQLRTRFAARLSDLYGSEVPAYRTLVEVSHEVTPVCWSEGVLRRSGWEALPG